MYGVVYGQYRNMEDCVFQYDLSRCLEYDDYEDMNQKYYALMFLNG